MISSFIFDIIIFTIIISICPFTKEKDDYHFFSHDKIINDNVENYPAEGDKSDKDEENADKHLILIEDELERRKIFKVDYLMSDENNKVGSVQILLFHEITKIIPFLIL